MDPRIYEQLHDIEASHWWFEGRRRILLAALERLGVEGDSILDVGCGAGTNLDLLGQRYPASRIVGIDVDLDPLRYCRSDRPLPVYQADAARLPFASGAFDLVCALDTLEHVENDEATLSGLHRVCRPGGTLLVTVPAFPFLWGNLDEAGRHYRRYTRSDLVDKIAAAGFSVRFVRFFNYLLFLPVAVIRLLARALPRRNENPDEELRTDFDRVKSGPINSLLARIFSLEAAVLWLSPPVGVSLLCIARCEKR